MTEYVGENTEKKAEFCDRSCEELGSMFTELTGLRIVVNSLTEKLEKVVGITSVFCSRCLVIHLQLLLLKISSNKLNSQVTGTTINPLFGYLPDIDKENTYMLETYQSIVWK